MNEHNQARSGDEGDLTAEDERAVRSREQPSGVNRSRFAPEALARSVAVGHHGGQLW
jgi:hypothetical protein